MATNGLKVVKNSILELRLILRKIKILLYIFLATKQIFQFHQKKMIGQKRIDPLW